jgi:phosphoserine phosphatase RsbU/P
MRRNAYKTNDPELLLRLKRQEADALLDVLRSMNQAHLRIEHIFKVARNTLLAQCEVRRMKFVYRIDDTYHTGVRHNFPKITPEAIRELPVTIANTKVDAEKHPALHALGVEYVVPINYKNQVAAWFLVAEFAEMDEELANDLIFIEIIGNVVSAALENRSLIEEMVQQESLRRELEVAEKIQRQLLPTNFDHIESAKVYAEIHAHHHVGGDFYDVISRGEKGFFVCIADVAGKGIGAALLMANLQANLRALILSENDLESVIRKLHDLLYGITGGDQFVTFFIAHVRPPEGEIDYINCGHNPPLLARDGVLRELNVGTIPLGIIGLPSVEEATIQYAPGDVFFMYTDGLMEQHNPADLMLGEHRIHTCLAEFAGQDVKEIVKEMKTMWETFRAGAEQEDDVTMLAVKF